MENKLVAPSDLVATPHMTPIARTREVASKFGSCKYDVGANHAADLLGI